MSLRVVIVGGGTGGHLFPGIAVGQEFRRLFKAEVIFLTTPKAVTRRVLGQYGLSWEEVQCRALKGQGLFGRIRACWSLPGSIWQAWRCLRRLKPALVLGMGGHVAGPVGLAAAGLGIPLAIHEQNTIPGVTNCLLARRARRVFLSFPDVQGKLPAERCRLTGNPIRGEFFQVSVARKARPFTVLVMGGSQGAHHLNVAVVEALGELADLKGELQFFHLTGEADEEMVKAAYGGEGFGAEVAAFSGEVASLMARAHLVVCRAGASTLAELAAMGRAGLLVPYPFAANNHQEYNARYFEAAGGAEVVLNKDFTGEVLAAKIRQLMASPEELAGREAASKSLAKPQAAREIVEGCMELLCAEDGKIWLSQGDG